MIKTQEVNKLNIRRADVNDPLAVQYVLIESIKSCYKDHHSDPKIIETWCKNKTEENISSWIQNDNFISLVAEDDKNNIIAIALLDVNAPHFYYAMLGQTINLKVSVKLCWRILKRLP